MSWMLELNTFFIRHIANFFKKNGREALLKDLVMDTSKATYLEDYEEKMNQIKEINNKAHDWLREEFPKKAV